MLYNSGREILNYQQVILSKKEKKEGQADQRSKWRGQLKRFFSHIQKKMHKCDLVIIKEPGKGGSRIAPSTATVQV